MTVDALLRVEYTLSGSYTKQRYNHAVEITEQGSAAGSYQCQLYDGTCIVGKDSGPEEVVDEQVG